MTSFTNRAEPGNTGTVHTSIPTEVRVEVWKSDSGQRVLCGEREIFISTTSSSALRGGSALAELNVELLYAGTTWKIRQDQGDGT